MKKKRFQKIYIEIINRCNLCCSFCPTSDRPSRMMSVDEFEKVAAQAAPFTDYICLHVKGEPDHQCCAAAGETAAASGRARTSADFFVPA